MSGPLEKKMKIKVQGKDEEAKLTQYTPLIIRSRSATNSPVSRPVTPDIQPGRRAK